jgi:lysophospholipase L1-like esterase
MRNQPVEQQDRPTIVFLGDSLTEGVIGASFVERLRVALNNDARIINAGINGDTVLNVRWRVARDVATHNPDIVVVMVGLNDLGTAYAVPVHRAYYRIAKGNLLTLTPRRFAAAYRALLSELRTQTRAQVLLCTPTTLTEQPDAPVQPIVDAYAAIVRAIAHQEGLPLVDLRATFAQEIANDPRPGPAYHISIAVRDMIATRLGRTTYAELTAKRGYRLLCDGVHLAEAGADLAASTILPQLRALIHSEAIER